MCNYLPLGSVVLLKGGSAKVLIIARALAVKKDDTQYFFDYGAVLYPDGLTGDQMAYFQHESISKVVYEGYRDIDDENVVENINRFLQDNPNILRGNADTWNN